jgi:hypothetical protein
MGNFKHNFLRPIVFFCKSWNLPRRPIKMDLPANAISFQLQKVHFCCAGKKNSQPGFELLTNPQRHLSQVSKVQNAFTMCTVS